MTFSLTSLKNFLIISIVLIVKGKGQQVQVAKPVLLALAFAGSWQSGRLQPLYERPTAQPFAGSSPALPASSADCPASSANYPQGTSSGRSQRTGLSRPTVILTQSTRKGKGKNDVPFVLSRTPKEKGRDDIGDQFVFIALERNTKLVITWHLGRRNGVNTQDFITKLRYATAAQRFQLSSDAFQAYRTAIEWGLHDRATTPK